MPDDAGTPFLLIASEQSLWITFFRRVGKDVMTRVEEVDARTGKARETYQLGKGAAADAIVHGPDVWIAMVDGRILALKDGQAKEISPKSSSVAAIAGDASSLWTLTEKGDVIQRDVLDGRVLRTIPEVASSALAAEAISGSLLMALGDGGVIRIAGDTGSVSNLDVEGSANEIEPCGNQIWLSQQILGQGALERQFGLRALDTAGNVLRTMRLEVPPRYLACDGSKIWVLAQEGDLGFVTV